jgi:penicillin amidase
MIVALINGISLLPILAIVVVLTSLPIAYWYFRRSLPQVAGTVKVSGLRHSVEIIRDIDAVPHIYAQDKLDVYFGLGYVHAQDRLWQMEFQRRFASGQVAAILGKRAVPLDRIVRTIGMHRAASSAWDSLSADAQDIVRAYTAGINACIGKCVLPPEFKLLRVEPAPWECKDVMVCSKLLAWNLGSTYILKMLREELVGKLGQQKSDQLMSDVSPWMPSSSPASGGQRDASVAHPDSTVFPIEEESVGAFRHGHEGIGSNNWVVSGEKSTTRKPMLAADPHLALGVPCTWYMAHLCADDLDAIGSTLPGIPGVIMGRNKNISWGLTNANGDVQDLYYERLSDDGTAAEFEGRLESIREIIETISVRGNPDVDVKVRITGHGPLISDAMNTNADDRRSDGTAKRQPMAFRWIALNGDDTTLEAFLGISTAGTWEEFNRALRKYVVPPVNFGYADKHGEIGYCLAGHIPIRDWDNSIPGEGWTGKQEWNGVIPFDEMPRLHNPAEQYVVTANTRLVPEHYGRAIGPHLVEPYRHNRIVELLESKPQLTLDDHAAIQGDVVSLHAREFLPRMLSRVIARNREQQRAIQALSEWDHEMHTGSVAASIFAAWFAQLPRLILGEEMGGKLFRDYQVWGTYVVRFLRDHSDLFADQRQENGSGNPSEGTEFLQRAFEMALADLKTQLGGAIENWQWGRLHKAVHAHQPFGSIPGLKQIFSRKMPHGGDWSTVNAGGTWSSKGSFEQNYGATYRQLVDLADEDRGRFIVSSGQSGHFLSPHYADCVKDWASVRYRQMRMRRTTVERDAAAKLCLEPNG